MEDNFRGVKIPWFRQKVGVNHINSLVFSKLQKPKNFTPRKYGIPRAYMTPTEERAFN